MYNYLVIRAFCAFYWEFDMVAGLNSTVFVNEFHYDNIGNDTGEFIEIANSGQTSLDGWTVVLYSGANGKPYATYTLTGNASLTLLTLPKNGLQNATGKPDGIALVNASKQVVQFLSYEGSFTATDGIAKGLTTTDIGVSQSNDSTTEGSSLQLYGTGSTYGDFSWYASSAHTGGKANNKQEFVVEKVTVVGDKGDDKLVGFDGSKDLIVTQAGNDTAYGMGSDDFLMGNKGSDTLYGGDGQDTLYGGTENDILYGDDGDDRLNGDKNNDELTGGKGADIFAFNKGSGQDVIHDFEDGIDRIEFSSKVFKNFDAVAASMGQDGADVVIKTAGGDLIRIENISLDQLTADDFLFV